MGTDSRTLLFAGIADGKRVMFCLWMELEPIHLLPDRSLEILKSLLLEGIWSQLIQFSTAQCWQPAAGLLLCQVLFRYRGQLLLI